MSAISNIIARLDRELAPKGFNRKKSTWNREQNPFVEVIDIQTRKTGEFVTMNSGVLSRPIYQACWGKDAGAFIEESDCTVRARVGQLIDNKDHWWDVNSKGVAEEIIICLEAQVFPFLQRMHSCNAMLDWLTTHGIPNPRFPLHSINFALLEFHLGDTKNACNILGNLQQKALGEWKTKAQEVSLRIGCTSASGS